MQCSSCGQKNSVVINHKRYCSDCGHPLSAKASKPLKKSGGILDLSNHVARLKKDVKIPHQFAAIKQPRSAQSMHGIRRPVQTKPQSHKIVRSPKILKFAKDATVHKDKDEAPVTPMAPHHSYAVAPKHAQLSAHLAKRRQHSYVQPVGYTTHQATKQKTSRLKRLTQPFKRHSRATMITAGALSALILGAYVTYLNLPNIKLRVAANRAGIDAQVPRYTPSGYDLKGPISSGPGRITIRFNSNSDDNYLDVAQQQTDWDSQSLLENYVLPKSEQYATFRENGLTIYLYNTNHAAWVNSGVFYSIDGKTKLNPEQILKIASSL